MVIGCYSTSTLDRHCFHLPSAKTMTHTNEALLIRARGTKLGEATPRSAHESVDAGSGN